MTFSCEHGCDEGFITTPGEERPCACLRGRRRAKPEFSPKLGVYAPGGVTTQMRRREAARLAGRASGRARRARSPMKRRMGRQAALALKYRHRQLDRKGFYALYEQHRPRPLEAPLIAVERWEMGRNIAWRYYRSLFRRFRFEGQHFRTTNGQRAAALANEDRPRCRRTVQRLNRLLEEMGVAKISWHKNQGNTPGHKDCLVVEIRTLCKSAQTCVTPPTGAPSIPSGLDDGALTSKAKSIDSTASRHVPPDGGDQHPPAAPAMSDEEVGRRLADFHQLKLELGMTSPKLELSPYLRKRRMDARYATGTSANAAATASTTWRGFK